MILEQFQKVMGKEIRRKSLDAWEGVIASKGSTSLKYNVTLRNGKKLFGVIGAAGHSVGDSVLVCFVAKTNSYIILSGSSKATSTIRTVVV